MKGRIHSIQTLGALDGPGLRCVIFLQGCPLRCLYCHNPDTWQTSQGEELETSELMDKVIRYKPYFQSQGGVTLSGGEPFMQGEWTAELLKGLKGREIHTTVDTSGYFLDRWVKEALEYVDLVILDIKHNEPEQYRHLTGKDLTHTLDFLRYVNYKRIPLWVRQVIVPGLNDTLANVRSLLELLEGISSLEKIELLPYHRMGEEKWRQLGLNSPLMGVKEPSPQKMQQLQKEANEILSVRLGDN